MNRAQIRHWLHEDEELFNELFPTPYSFAARYLDSANRLLKEAEAVTDTAIHLMAP